jgi:hypothetical protein
VVGHPLLSLWWLGVHGVVRSMVVPPLPSPVARHTRVARSTVERSSSHLWWPGVRGAVRSVAARPSSLFGGQACRGDQIHDGDALSSLSNGRAHTGGGWIRSGAAPSSLSSSKAHGAGQSGSG